MIKEANISYTPEKIDEFVDQAKKDLESAKNIFNVAYQKVRDMSVSNIIDNKATAENYLEKIKAAGETISKKHTRYFNIVDFYEVGEYPDNVKQLDTLTSKLDNYYYDLMKVEDVLEALIEAAEKLTNFYNQEQI